ncbi:MAG: hypothetical protein LH478_05245, partial [Chitinophagaceae bacterium]|nr:hypothetical protein [Chitinophagaceae bacterium]
MELSENYQFNYRKLLKFLSRKDSSGYMFAMADDYRFISQINTSLQAELEQSNTNSSIVFLQSNADEPLVEQLKAAGTFAHAIIVANLYEVINSADGLNQLLLLNFSREELRSIQSPALFWVDAQSLNVIANQAPDLFSQRRFTTIHFTGKVEHPMPEVLEKPDWQEYVNTDKFKETEARIETLKRRFEDAEESGYNASRIASEIAIPLAFEYAQLGFAEKAEVLLTKYEALLDNTNSNQLKQLAKVYYQLHQYPVAIETLQKANDIIERNLSKQARDTVYPSDWFYNIIDLSDWMKEYGLPNDAINLLTKAETLLLENIGQYPVNTKDNIIALFKERLGDLHFTLGNLEKAKDYFEQGLNIAQQLERSNPHREQLKRNLSVSYDQLGD